MKYNIGDKVVPFQKTIDKSFENSCIWQQAKSKNQNYLFIIRYDENKKYYVLDSKKDSYSGDHFNECDFYLYEENKMIDNELNKKLDEAQSQFENKLNECRNRFNMRLNEIRQEIKKESFIKVGQKYWYISSIGEILYNFWKNDTIDNYHLIYNNIWFNKADCERYNEIDKKYRQLVFDENLKNPIDWNDDSQKKYNLFYIISDDSIELNYNTYKYQAVYCTNKNIKQLAIDLIGEEDLKWYLKEYRE